MKVASKNLVLIILTVICLCPRAFGATQFQQTIQTTIPGAVNISAVNPSSASGTINPSNGASSSPSVNFSLQTNGTDENYTFVVTATLSTNEGTNTNAYAQINSQPYILLGNNSPSYYPTTGAVNNVVDSNPSVIQNANVIAYPLATTISNFSSATLTTNSTYGGLCYLVTIGDSQNGALTQTLGTSPLENTYSCHDIAGIYQADVTFSAYANP